MKLVIFYLLIIYSNLGFANSIKIIGEDPVYVKKQESEIFKVIEYVFNIFKIKDLKQPLIIELKEGIFGYSNSVYHTDSNHITMGYSNKNEKINKKVLSHELSHFIIRTHLNHIKIIQLDFFEELIPDIISSKFNLSNNLNLCELKGDRLEYKKITYNKKDENFFNPYFYIRKSFNCCKLDSSSNFCLNLKKKSEYFSLEFEAINNIEKKYPFKKDFIDNHYIGLPIISYLKESNILTDSFINKLLSSKEKTPYLFFKKNYYNSQLWNKYNLEFIK